MSYCKYHPLKAATFFCTHCQHATCDQCANEDRFKDAACFYCSKPMRSLGSAHSAEPFWRRLDKSFRYPLNSNALILIIGIAVLDALLGYLPFATLLQLVLSSIILSYCFACLEQTAKGKLVAPDITRAYDGGLVLLGKLLLIVLAPVFLIGLSYQYIGSGLATILTLTTITCMPAAIILFSISGSLAEAINPLKQLRLVMAIGLPYGLIFAFIIIMAASVNLIHQALPQFSLLTGFLQSAISNYYTIVIFHIMGYMIFQYQGELGFTAREDNGEKQQVRNEFEKNRQLVNILAKEAEFEAVFKELVSAIKRYPDDPWFAKQGFEFIHQSRNTNYIDAFGSFYLEYLIRHKQDYQLNNVYKRILQIKPDFQPDTTAIRHELARVLYNGGDARSAVKLLNGLHKEFPDYQELVAAYELMAQALEDVPGMQKQAVQYRQFAAKLQQKKPSSGHLHITHKTPG